MINFSPLIGKVTFRMCDDQMISSWLSRFVIANLAFFPLRSVMGGGVGKEGRINKCVHMHSSLTDRKVKLFPL